MGNNDFNIFCIYEKDIVKINDYAKDFVRNKGVFGLLVIYMYSNVKNSTKGLRIDLKKNEFEIFSNKKHNYFTKMCVNYNGYVYVLGEEIKVELLGLRPLKTGSISKNGVCDLLDKHLELEFLATEIKEKGQNNFKKIKNIFTFKKYFKFYNEEVVFT